MRMIKMIKCAGVALIALAVGCGDEFSTSSSGDAGVEGSTGFGGSTGGSSGTGGSTGGSSGTGGSTGGSSGDGGSTGGSSGDGGSTGGSSGDGGTAGDGGSTGGSSGDGGSTGGSSGDGGTAGDGGSVQDAGPEADASDPCLDELTANEASGLLNKPCSDFPYFSCGTNDPLPRGEFIKAVVQVSGKTAGFEAPAIASFNDVAVGSYYFDGVEKAVWLELVPPGGAFHPDNPALRCWAQALVTKMEALPAIYAVVTECAASQSITVGPVPVMAYAVYGTGSGNHLTQLLRVVNNEGNPPDFTTPQPTGAFALVSLTFESPFKSYDKPLDSAGKADFGNVDAFAQAGGVLIMRIAVTPNAVTGMGEDGKLGLDPTTIKVRGGQACAPTITVN